MIFETKAKFETGRYYDYDFLRRGVTRAVLKHDGESGRLQREVDNPCDYWNKYPVDFFKNQVGIGSVSQDFGGEAAIIL